MTETESDNIAKEIKSIFDKMIEYSEKAQAGSFLSCFDNSPTFLHVSSDGKMRNYEEFKKTCVEYYITLKQQKLSTIKTNFNVIDINLVIVAWTGNIIAQFRNGDTMSMNNYSITNIFKRDEGKWTIIHAHESYLPPVTQKSKN